MTTAEFGNAAAEVEITTDEPEAPAADQPQWLEAMDPHAGLRAALRDNIGDEVTLHISGGSALVQVTGRILEVEETMVTVGPKRTPTYVPIHFIVIAEELGR